MQLSVARSLSGNCDMLLNSPRPQVPLREVDEAALAPRRRGHRSTSLTRTFRDTWSVFHEQLVAVQGRGKDNAIMCVCMYVR